MPRRGGRQASVRPRHRVSICAKQHEDGSWEEEYWTGTGFPGVFYLRYHLYGTYFPLLALSRYSADRSPSAIGGLPLGLNPPRSEENQTPDAIPVAHHRGQRQTSGQERCVGNKRATPSC